MKRFILLTLALASAALAQPVLPTPDFKSVTTNADGTLRGPANFWTANASAMATALSLSTTYQPLDADLTSIAALTTTPFGRSLLTQADAPTLRTTAGLTIGTNVQAWSANLDTLSGATIADTAAIGGAIRLACWGDSLTSGAGGTPYPTQIQPLTGYIVYNGGVGGETSTQIKDRMIAAPDKYDSTTIIWAGRNNAAASATVQADIAAMVAALGHNRYLVLGVLNGNYAGEESGGGGYNQIVALNSALASTYGAHYIDMRAHLVSLYDPEIPQDVTDHTNDIPPSSLRSDAIHLNTAGYAAVAAKIVAEITKLQVTDEVVTAGPLVGAFGRFAATPPPIGSTTPAAGSFTAITGSSLALTGNIVNSVATSATSYFNSASYQDLRLTGRSGGSGSGGAQLYFDTTGSQSWLIGQRTDATFAGAGALFFRDMTNAKTVLSFTPSTGAAIFEGDLTIDANANAARGAMFTNRSTGSSAVTQLLLRNSVGAASQTGLLHYSTAGAYGAFSAGTGGIYGNSGRVTIMSDGASGVIHFATGGSASRANFGTDGALHLTAAPLEVASGGTGATSAASAATALGLGMGDSPQFAAVRVIAGAGAGIITSQGTTEGNLNLIDTGATTGTRVANWNNDGGVLKLRLLNDAANSVLGTPYQINLVTGAITGGTYNGNTITTGSGTLTLGTGKTLTASNTLTLTGTDGSTLAIGTGGTLGTAAYTASSAYETKSLTATAALDFGEIAAGASADLTITVSGAVVGYSTTYGLPAAPTAGITWGSFVSAADTVTIRASNITGSPVDPASATYRATVFVP